MFLSAVDYFIDGLMSADSDILIFSISFLVFAVYYFHFFAVEPNVSRAN